MIHEMIYEMTVFGLCVVGLTVFGLCVVGRCPTLRLYPQPRQADDQPQLRPQNRKQRAQNQHARHPK
jgi:hypothetical protein